MALLARFSEPIVPLAEGPHAARIEKVTHPVELALALREAKGPVPYATFVKHVRTKTPPVAIDQGVVAIARRELRALASAPVLSLAKENRRAFARYGRIDEAWLRERTRDVARANDALACARLDWFATVIELVRARDGDQAALRVQMAHDDVVAAATERRKRARDRVRAIVDAVTTGVMPDDAELEKLAQRLDAARDFPGRARRRRVLDVLRTAIGWVDAPRDAVDDLADPAVREGFAEIVLRAGYALADSLPAVRDPKERDRALDDLAVVALAFPVGDDGITPLPADVERKDVLRLTEKGVTAAQAIELIALGLKSDHDQLARWVSQGLDVALVAEAIEKGFAAELARVPDVRAARAYATWAARLVPHYKSLGITFSLTPELFAALPRNVDLGVLAVCLLEATKLDDPAAVLDATLGLFAKLPAKATRILSRLRAVQPGTARRTFGEFAEWIDEDELLDRLVHVARLAGEAQPLTHRIREDFDHAQKIARELDHLESMTKRNVPQEGRLALLRKGPRSIADAPKGRTKRRIAERIDALMPIAYRRELDAAFREISREAWGVDVPALTPAWRDAVRFWLVVDENKKLLGLLLREAAKKTDAKLASPKNRAWIAQAGRTIDVEQWLAPRKKTFSGASGARYTIELEEDPLEVLRMGIPFGTCLSLEDGCNAASTVLNALDANKRVIYVRGANGKVLARKLVALNEELALIGYNLYVSVSGGDEAVIREAVEDLCREIAKDVGVRLAVSGQPATIHKGFWYDDGVVAFAQDEVVGAYCRAHGVSPPKETWTSFVNDARGWWATDRDDIDGAIDALAIADNSISNVILARWVASRLTIGDARRRMRMKGVLLPALCRVLSDEGEAGIVRAFDLIGAAREGASQYGLTVLATAAPRSAKIADAFVRAAERLVTREPRLSRWGTPHRTFDDVATFVDGVGTTLALCDRLDPLWREVERAIACTDCRMRGYKAMIDATLDAYDREPDDDAVVACLMSARRSDLAHRAALHIAARRFLDDGARAMRRFMSYATRKKLAKAPDTIAALVRQSGIAEALRAPTPAAPIFEALGPLLFSLPVRDVSALLARAPVVVDDAWNPGPWELAWRRRHPDAARRARLVADAVQAPYAISRSLERIALLADQSAWSEIEKERLRGSDWSATLKPAERLKSHAEIDAAYAALVAQVAATERGSFDVVPGPIDDRLYVERAKDALPADAPIVAAIGTPDAFMALLRSPPSVAIDAALAIALTKPAPARPRLDPRLVVELWQRRALRDALAGAVVADARSSLKGIEHAAKAASLSIDGLFEAVTKARLATSASASLYCDSLDELHAVIALAVREAAPAKVAELYQEMNDLPAIAAFLRAFAREPVDRASAIRAEMTFPDDDAHHHALKKWVDEQAKARRAIERA